MSVYEKKVMYAHGYAFDIVKTRFGLNISHAGLWVWRAKTLQEARRIVRKTGIRYLRENLK